MSVGPAETCEDDDLLALFADLEVECDTDEVPPNLLLVQPIIVESRWGDGSEKDLNTDLMGLFWDDEGNAVLQGDAECADGATDLKQV